LCLFTSECEIWNMNVYGHFLRNIEYMYIWTQTSYTASHALCGISYRVPRFITRNRKPLGFIYTLLWRILRKILPKQLIHPVGRDRIYFFKKLK
jgi:hypothetical protein